MKLDYSRLDPELLPILESFPALNISRDNILEIRLSSILRNKC